MAFINIVLYHYFSVLRLRCITFYFSYEIVRDQRTWVSFTINEEPAHMLGLVPRDLNESGQGTTRVTARCSRNSTFPACLSLDWERCSSTCPHTPCNGDDTDIAFRLNPGDASELPVLLLQQRILNDSGVTIQHCPCDIFIFAFCQYLSGIPNSWLSPTVVTHIISCGLKIVCTSVAASWDI